MKEKPLKNFTMRINETEHYKHNWVAHELLKDFEVEDVWRFPVSLESHHTVVDFREQMLKALEDVEQKGLPGLLFKFRMFLGRIFDWDEDPEQHELLAAGSMRERYAKVNQLAAEDLPAPGNGEFVPVFENAEESLAEIENATVHAGLHLGKVAAADGKYTIQMAVYVKPKGMLGRAYMALIKPFRYAIVYPAIMRLAGKKWKKFLDAAPV